MNRIARLAATAAIAAGAATIAPYAVPGSALPYAHAAGVTVRIGQPIFFPIGHGVGGCTAGFGGYLNGKPIAVTAAHCGAKGTPVYSNENLKGSPVGHYATPNDDAGYAIIDLAPGVVPSNRNGKLNITGIDPQPPATGQPMCKMGMTTGFTCGNNVFSSPTSAYTTICGNHGDSGAPVFSGTTLRGLIQGSSLPIEAEGCIPDAAISTIGPVVSSIEHQGNFRLA